MIGRRTFLARSCTAAATTALLSSLGQRRAWAQPTRPAEPRQVLMRKIPRSGEQIPAVGMGTWQTFDVDPADEKKLAPLAEVLQIFFDAGGRVIDSSPMYGRAEEVTGLLSDRLKVNDKLWLATKVWTGGEEAGIAQMKRSLDRMKRGKLELMQIHNLTDWRVQLKTLRAWKERGALRYIGITHYAPGRFDEMERILRDEKLDFVQLPYSIAMRKSEERLLPVARDTGTAVLVMRPFEGGNLFASTRDKPLPDVVTPWAASWGGAFLKFILAHDAVTCVIPATSKPQHMRDNIEAGYGRLPSEEERTRLVESLGV
jgi:diketogulonate reductase-like aldo/keto reductase